MVRALTKIKKRNATLAEIARNSLASLSIFLICNYSTSFHNICGLSQSLDNNRSQKRKTANHTNANTTQYTFC